MNKLPTAKPFCKVFYRGGDIFSLSRSRVRRGRSALVRSTVEVFRGVHILALCRGIVGSPEQTVGNFL